MKNLIFTLIALLSFSTLAAQNREALNSRLAEPTTASNSQVGSVEVRHSSSAEEALEKIDAQRASKSVMGYRVGIFFDNGQNARSKAAEARELFRSHFAVPVYMVYQSPYYKVSAGDCLTEEEAIILFERIRPLFPNAYVMREKMDLSDFIINESQAIAIENIMVEPQDSTLID